MAFKTLDDVPLKGKTVFCRLDLNCPIDLHGRPERSARVVAHARTVLDLSRKGARTVLLAHQGRLGDKDCISLSPHAKLLEEEVARLNRGPAVHVRFVPDVCGSAAQAAIHELADGEVLLLENVRFLEDETKYEKNGRQSRLVSALDPYCQVFVLDAFSCAHRAHASVVGFGRAPALAGRVMAEELAALESFSQPERPVVFVLGGAKPDDSLPILESWLEAGKLDHALCGGALGNLMLLASGRDIGEGSVKFLKDKGALEYLPAARDLYRKHSDKIVAPLDVVADLSGQASVLELDHLPVPSPIMDIGPKTAARFASIIGSAGSIVLNGPMGVYEKEAYSMGTRTVFEAVASTPAFSLLGGGHTLSALDTFQIDRAALGYVSLSGKALIEYLAGESLPGVELLRGAYPPTGAPAPVLAKPSAPSAKPPAPAPKPSAPTGSAPAPASARPKPPPAKPPAPAARPKPAAPKPPARRNAPGVSTAPKPPARRNASGPSTAPSPKTKPKPKPPAPSKR